MSLLSHGTMRRMMRQRFPCLAAPRGTSQTREVERVASGGKPLILAAGSDRATESPSTSTSVSVIIPTHNRARYLSEAIRSVLVQTFTDFELIIVDDGSTDETEELVRSFSDRRIRYLWQSHQGISAARNAAIRSARGLYVAHLDSDDIWLPNILGVEVAAFCDPGIGVVYSRAQALDQTGRPLPILVGIPQRYPADSLLSLLYSNVTAAIVDDDRYPAEPMRPDAPVRTRAREDRQAVCADAMSGHVGRPPRS